MSADCRHKTRTPCTTCNGTGLLHSFVGENRFFPQQEECPVCCGFGSVDSDPPPAKTPPTDPDERGN
ncbi:MAG: hypothetical protein ACOX5Z_12050 [Desulfobulbus sp.]|jgi:DnaJ-class molecular chaperone